MSPSGSSGASRSQPEVHSVSVNEQYVTVHSAGLSVRYFGPLQSRPIPAAGLQSFEFRIPVHPRPESGRHTRVPADVLGVFVNGLPIYNQFESLSWNGANVWHYDAVAQRDNGTLTASGRARADLTHPSPPGLLDELALPASRHSPLIGFALDGYPVYGPWAYSEAGGGGELRRMRSSYRLRSQVQRRSWPGGIQLMPAQYGPDRTAEPPGTFAEDYEYVRGSGDLDEHNGRFAVTPEYPQGTYAYFLTTDAAGRLAFPYLIGPTFYGRVTPSGEQTWHTLACKRIHLAADLPRIEANRPVRLHLQAKDAAGDPIRAFEYVHERPIHLLIASADLADFDHIHPELSPSDSFEVTYTFRHGGRYRIWADYSLPGEAPHLEEFDVTVEGPGRPEQKLVASASFTQTAGPLMVSLTLPPRLSAGKDVPFTLKFTGSTEALEPYLGAWAHVIVVGSGWRSFAHAHPIDSPGLVHTHAPAGPPPEEVRILTSFPTQGMYKLWVQLQNAGQVLTIPFVLAVGPKVAASTKTVRPIPTGAYRIRISQHGYNPANVTIPANAPVTLAFTRESTPNCGAEVVFPALGLRKALPLGETVLIQLPAQTASEISFSCGMGMYRAMIVAR
ncbi:MAG: YHYH protein [Acidobacteria bacterium]|nr:YHYH protein [Acidobacteriota bacterium]